MNPMHRIDTAPIEHAVEHAIEVVTDTFGDVTETLGERFHDDVVPLAKHSARQAKEGARQTRTFVRRRTRVSLATVVGVVALIGFVVWLRRRDGSDHPAAQSDLDQQRAARSVA